MSDLRWIVIPIILVFLAFSVLSSLLLLVVPTTTSTARPPTITEDDFVEEDTTAGNEARSGWSYYVKHRNAETHELEPSTSVQVVVLGDIGRSPRMQYHALSIAQHGGRVDLIGYVEAELHPEVVAHRLIRVLPLEPYPALLQSGTTSLPFLVTAPLKVIWQIASLFYTLAYASQPAPRWILVQNPPSIPLLLIARIAAYLRRTKLAIDWHNFGYTLLALRLSPKHPLVKLAQWYEGLASRTATAHFAVTDAMCAVLKRQWGIEAVALHDRPAAQFQPLSPRERQKALHSHPETSEIASSVLDSTVKLVVSSTSWTADEDFSLLLSALVTYSARARSSGSHFPKQHLIITGRGPQKSHYEERIQSLTAQGKLSHAVVRTAWLSSPDYASLLACADLGISLHQSSSGVDLPMKVVDYLGAGLPVSGYSRFEAWPELVQEGVNGLGFGNAEELAEVLEEVFVKDEKILGRLKEGALKDGKRRWSDEWDAVAGKVFGVVR